MKPNYMRKIFSSKYSILLLLIIVLSIISAVGKYTTTNITKSLESSKSILHQYIVAFDKEVETQIANNAIDSFSFNKNNHFININKNYTLLLYKNDEVVFWTENSISFPAASQLKNKTRSIQKLKNVWCYLSVHSYNDTTLLVAVLPIKYTQDIKNNYLTDEFIVRNIDDQFDLSINVSNNDNVIFNKYNEPLFSITTKDIIKKYNSAIIYVLTNFILLLLLFFLAYQIADTLANYIADGLAFLILIFFLSILRVLFSYTSWMYHLQNSSLFDPTLYGSNNINSSLGVFIINAIIFAIVAYYFYSHIRLKKIQLPTYLYKIGIGIIMVFIYCFHLVLIYTYKDLIVNSTIPLDLTNILKINFYSIIVYSVFAILSLAYVLISFNLFKIFNRLYKINTIDIILFNLIAILFYIFLIRYFELEAVCYTGIIIVLAWNILIQYYYSNKKPFESIFEIIIILGFISLVSAIYSNFFHVTKNKIITEDTIHKLADDRDYVTEFSFTDIHCRVTEDAFLKRIFENKIPIGNPNESIINRIKQLYFKSYMSKYNLDIHLYNRDGQSVIENDTIPLLSYQETIDKYGFETSDYYLHFIEKSSENYYYSAVIPVFKDTTQIGMVAFNLKPKVSNDENVYPELLISKNIQKLEDINESNYLVINNKRILKSKGSIPYEFTNLLNTNITIDSFIWLKDQLTLYTIYKPNDKKSIIYSKEKISIYKYITSYSYILILNVLIAVFFFICFLIYSVLEDFHNKPWNTLSLAFHDKINITLFSLLLFSFFAIAIITTLFISYQYETNNKQNLVNISIRVSTQLQEYIIKYNIIDTNSLTIKEDFSYLIPQLSNDEKIDINLFDTKGNLAISSQSSIFEKGLLATKMNPIAYTTLKNRITNQVLQNEEIGKLNYLSLYMPLYNDKNELLAYMNIPYFSQTKTLKDEISRFLVALINVYVPLLIITGLLALLISNSLTRPLNQIGNQLRKIRLGKVNESIEWHQKDEIGLLVDEYNKMIIKLDESANSLKKNEREGAWREMAKQIAHEIKNPLTPMRLSIQYLQRAIQENNPNTAQLTLNMTHTLIEQIDNLSEIATAFSSFAQMPVANNEKLDLDHYLASIINLFSEENNVRINYLSYTKPAWIFADKNQMISLFNNLIKNAIQAIHEDSQGVIDIYLLEEYGTIKTIIMDNGKGIPDDIKDRIFTPNFTTKNSGSGLGLAISKQIIENAGGSIWFESQENYGTTFYVVIPKYTEATKNDTI